jgi:hypothetical protein
LFPRSFILHLALLAGRPVLMGSKGHVDKKETEGQGQKFFKNLKKRGQKNPTFHRFISLLLEPLS